MPEPIQQESRKYPDQLVLECNGSVPNYIPESIKFVYCSLVEGLLRVQSLMVMIGCYGLCDSPYDSFSHTHIQQ